MSEEMDFAQLVAQEDEIKLLEAENKRLRDALEDTDMNRKHAEGSTMTIDSEELVKRMKAFGLKGVRDGSVHFFIKPELLAEFLEAEIRAEREACAKTARQLETENKRLREALEARRDWFAMQLKDTGNGNLSEWDRHTLQIELDAANAALNAIKGS